MGNLENLELNGMNWRGEIFRRGLKQILVKPSSSSSSTSSNTRQNRADKSSNWQALKGNQREVNKNKLITTIRRVTIDHQRAFAR